MNDIAAPLYLIMVDHGNTNIFYVGNETISPSELNGWLKNLEQNLDAEALSEKRVMIMGACYSGSFIPDLSGAGRILITSAAADEESYKGPLEPPKGEETEAIRVGEYFLEELFKSLNKGSSLKASFESATGKTEIYTRRGGLLANSSNLYFDDAMQHPLLDDDGDGKGSNALMDGQGDGQVAADIYLGVGVTNSASNSADLVEVTKTLYLSPDETKADLRAKVADNDQVSWVWMEVRTPSKVLVAQGGSNQLEVDLDRHFMTFFDPPVDTWLKKYEDFTLPGKYELFYFSQDVETGNISPMKRSVVYKKKAGNVAPGTFNLISPIDGESDTTALMFKSDIPHHLM